MTLPLARTTAVLGVFVFGAFGILTLSCPVLSSPLWSGWDAGAWMCWHGRRCDTRVQSKAMEMKMEVEVEVGVGR